MASNFSRQTDWELFPPNEYGVNYLDDPTGVTIDQVEDLGDEKNIAPTVPRPILHRSISEGDGRVTWSSSATTPTQTPQSFLSSYFRSPTERTTAGTTMTATTPARQGLSPSSSPRLPSPPPYTEVQIGPKSPSIGHRDENELTGDVRKQDDGSSRRIRPGTKSADMASGPPLVPLAQVCTYKR